jgi:hypothetical protein
MTDRPVREALRQLAPHLWALVIPFLLVGGIMLPFLMERWPVLAPVAYSGIVLLLFLKKIWRGIRHGWRRVVDRIR